MTTRPIAMLVLGSLLSSLPAAADRRSKRRVAEEEASEKEDSDGPEATAVVSIKLDDLIEVAVRLAPELARSKNDRLAAKGDAVASRRDQQWQVTSEGKYKRVAFAREVEVGPFGTAAEDTVSASLGIGRNIPTGGNIALQFGILRTVKELEIPSGIADQVGAAGIPREVDGGTVVNDTFATIQSSAKLIFKQPIVRGFGKDVALAQQTKADLFATEATVKTQLAAEEMLKEVVGAYWELAYAAYEVDTRAESLALAKKQEELTRIEVRAKTASEQNLTAVLYEVQIREEALLVAKNEWEKKSLDMRKRAGLELDRRDLVMRPGDAFEAADDEWEVSTVLERARKSNRRMASLILQKRAADVDVKVAKNAMLPKVDLELSGTLFGQGSDTSAAFSATANSNGYEVLAGLTVQFDIGGAAKGAHDAALARRQKIEVDQADASRTLDTEVVHAVHQVKSARARIGFADRAIQYAEDNVRAERAAYQTKARTNFDVMQRQTELVNARLRRGRAIADYHLAVANVQFLGGFLLEQYRVNVRPLAKSR